MGNNKQIDELKQINDLWSKHFPKALKLSILIVLCLAIIAGIGELLSDKTYERVPIEAWYQFLLYGLFVTIQFFPLLLIGLLLFFNYESKKRLDKNIT
jgi:hypothetical protein